MIKDKKSINKPMAFLNLSDLDLFFLLCILPKLPGYPLLMTDGNINFVLIAVGVSLVELLYILVRTPCQQLK